MKMRTDGETKRLNALRVGALRLVAYGGYAYTYAVRFNDGETVYPELLFKTEGEYSAFADSCGNGNGHVQGVDTIYHDGAELYLDS